MKKVKSIYAGLIAAVLLASVSMSVSAQVSWRTAEQNRIHLEHWYPHDNGLEYFFLCTIGGDCEGSKWR